MSFTPFARYRNFTLANLKALLEVYPDMARSIPWEEAIVEVRGRCMSSIEFYSFLHIIKGKETI